MPHSGLRVWRTSHSPLRLRLRRFHELDRRSRFVAGDEIAGRRNRNDGWSIRLAEIAFRRGARSRDATELTDRLLGREVMRRDPLALVIEQARTIFVDRGLERVLHRDQLTARIADALEPIAEHQEVIVVGGRAQALDEPRVLVAGRQIASRPCPSATACRRSPARARHDAGSHRRSPQRRAQLVRLVLSGAREVVQPRREIRVSDRRRSARCRRRPSDRRLRTCARSDGCAPTCHRSRRTPLRARARLSAIDASRTSHTLVSTRARDPSDRSAAAPHAPRSALGRRSPVREHLDQIHLREDAEHRARPRRRRSRPRRARRCAAARPSRRASTTVETLRSMTSATTVSRRRGRSPAGAAGRSR